MPCVAEAARNSLCPKEKICAFDRIAHQVEPRTRKIGIVPHLLTRAAIGDDLPECFVIPEIGMLKDHRHSLEVAAARRATQPFHQFGELVSAGRDDPLGRSGTRGASGTSGAGGKRGGTDRKGAKAEKGSAP